MKMKLAAGWALCGLVSLVLAGSLSAQEAPRKEGRLRPRRSGIIQYRIRNDATVQQRVALESILCGHGANHSPRLGILGVEGHCFDPSGSREEDVAARIAATGAVDFAEPDYRHSPAAIPNDPQIGYQWHHTVMRSPEAWDVSVGSTSVLVAVCDTGVRSTHPDLSANLQLPGLNVVDGSTYTEPADAYFGGHGTMVAGCIGAVGNNGIGVTGVAWRVRILPVRVTNDYEGLAYLSDIAAGIRAASDRGARIINVSYGVGYSTTVDAACRYARSRGALVFISAGNDGYDISSWPSFSSSILVGGTGMTDYWDYRSNYGSPVDLVAPFSDIATTAGYAGLGAFSGTSFSSPLAVGVAALILSRYPGSSVGTVENILYASCKDLGAPGKDPFFGHGRVDAAAALGATAGNGGSDPEPDRPAPGGGKKRSKGDEGVCGATGLEVLLVFAILALRKSRNRNSRNTMARAR